MALGSRCARIRELACELVASRKGHGNPQPRPPPRPRPARCRARGDAVSGTVRVGGRFARPQIHRLLAMSYVGLYLRRLRQAVGDDLVLMPGAMVALRRDDGRVLLTKRPCEQTSHRARRAGRQLASSPSRVLLLVQSASGRQWTRRVRGSLRGAQVRRRTSSPCAESTRRASCRTAPTDHMPSSAEVAASDASSSTRL